MRGLLVRDGDLVVGEGGFLLVGGSEKVRQDLSIAASEPYGSDRFHPGWGTLLDRYVAMADPDEGTALVRSEIARLVQNLITTQVLNLQQDRQRGRAPRYSAEELVDSIQEIRVVQQTDRFFVQVTVSTLSGSTLNLNGSVGS